MQANFCNDFAVYVLKHQFINIFFIYDALDSMIVLCARFTFVFIYTSIINVATDIIKIKSINTRKINKLENTI